MFFLFPLFPLNFKTLPGITVQIYAFGNELGPKSWTIPSDAHLPLLLDEIIAGMFWKGKTIICLPCIQE